MSSTDSLTARNLLKEGVVGYVVDDTPVALRLRYTGTGSVTSVTVDTGTDLEAITSDGGTETWAFATYDDVGKLADIINDSEYWECKVLDALRSDATVSVFVNGAIAAGTVDGVTYYDVLTDTDALDSYTYRLSYDRHVNENKPKGSHRVHLLEFTYNVDVNAASADGVQVWECDDDGNTETQIISRKSVDATETTVNWASGEGKVTAGVGNDLVVRITDSTSITDSSDNFLEVVGEKE